MTKNGKVKYVQPQLQIEKIIEFIVSFLNGAVKPFFKSQKFSKSELE